MKNVRKICYLPLVLASSLFMSDSVNAQIQPQNRTPASNVYSSREACSSSRVYSAQECANAFANARAELDEKAPRFQSRAECEKYFKRCMISSILGSRKVELGPVMSGVEMTSGPSAKMVLPRVEEGGAELALSPRQIGRPEISVTAERRSQALISWKQAIERKTHPPASENSTIAPPTSIMNGSEPHSATDIGLKPTVAPR